MSWINLLCKVKNGKEPNPNPSISARLHVNYWKLPSDTNIFGSKKYTRCLDIGVVLENVSDDILEVAICLPFKVKKDNISDLSPYLHDEIFVSYLLNGRYRCLTLKDCPTYHYLQLQDEQTESKHFCLYEIVDTSKEVKDLKNGSMLLIKIQSYPKNLQEIKEKPNGEPSDKGRYNLYFRFRINGLTDNDLCYNENISNDFVQSAFSKSEMAEIKFNDLRNINHSDYQQITKEHFFLNLSKIDFFFTGSSEDESVSGSSAFEDCELLDTDIWGKYMPGINSNEKKCISYHWIVDAAEKNKVFFKTVYSSPNSRKLLKYSFCVIFLSFVASCILEGIKMGVNAAFTEDVQNTDSISESINNLNDSIIEISGTNK